VSYIVVETLMRLLNHQCVKEIRVHVENIPLETLTPSFQPNHVMLSLTLILAIHQCS